MSVKQTFYYNNLLYVAVHVVQLTYNFERVGEILGYSLRAEFKQTVGGNKCDSTVAIEVRQTHTLVEFKVLKGNLISSTISF